VQIIFPEWPINFLVITIHQVIWPSPGTLQGPGVPRRDKMYIDRWSSWIVKLLFVWKLSNVKEFEYMWPGFQISGISEVKTSWVLLNHFAMEECDGGRRRCWAYAAKRPGFSIVQVLFIHILCSRRKILAVPHISSAPRRGDTLLGANRFEGGHHR